MHSEKANFDPFRTFGVTTPEGPVLEDTQPIVRYGP